MPAKNRGYFFNWWAEILTVVFLIVGYMIGAAMRNQHISLVAAVICGILFGRFTHIEHEDHFVPALIVAGGFIIGLTTGDKMTSDVTLLVLFVISLALSYYIHREGFLDKLT